MSSTDRLERLIEDEIGECCAGDVEARLSELRELERESLTEGIDRDVAVFGALASETRYRIVRLLANADELCVCEFAPLLDVSDSAISHALSDLVDTGLVDRRKEGKWRYYRATDRAEALVEAIDATREGDD